MSVCRVRSWGPRRGCLLWPVHSLDKTLSGFALLHFVLHGQSCLLHQLSLDFLLLHSSLLWMEKTFFFFFLLLVLEGLVGHHQLFNLSFFSISGWSIELDYCDIKWIAVEMNRDHCVISEIAPILGMLHICSVPELLSCEILGKLPVSLCFHFKLCDLRQVAWNLCASIFSCVIFGKLPDLSVLPYLSSVTLGKFPNISVLLFLTCVILGKFHDLSLLP